MNRRRFLAWLAVSPLLVAGSACPKGGKRTDDPCAQYNVDPSNPETFVYQVMEPGRPATLLFGRKTAFDYQANHPRAIVKRVC